MYILNTKIAIQTYYQNNLLEILGLLPKQTCTFLLIWIFFFKGTLVKNLFVDVLGIKSFIYIDSKQKTISKQIMFWPLQETVLWICSKVR